MTKVVFLGAGAAPGVPSLSCGWGDCNPRNSKNIRSRTTTYYNFNGTEILIDTSPDLRLQLIGGNIRRLDGVLYTHVHADHLHGIDDLREINRIHCSSINFYCTAEVLNMIKERFNYLVADPGCVKDVIRQPSLIANEVRHNQPFYINDVKITPIKLIGHNTPVTGYVFNDGEVVHIADFRAIDDSGLEQIKRAPRLMIMPLTTPKGQTFHAGLEEVMSYAFRLKPEQVVLNHMASECDYDAIDAATPDFVTPAYDNMTIEFEN